ncbi:MAG: glycosyltransferase family 4 protein [Acidimicrobiia bacterium]|nr:glycosyltransferase family 4 protein [Acidimicrobiia bacterium]
MKVGVNLLWLVPGQVGGTEEYAVRLLEHVADVKGVEITVFAGRAALDAHPFLRSAFRAAEGPVTGGRPGRVVTEATWLAAQSRRRDLDLVHHLGGTTPLVRGAPAIVTIHDLQPLEHPEAFSAVKRHWLARMLPHAVRNARFVVAVSEFTARAVQERLGVARDRIRVVRHGFDPPKDALPPAEIERVRTRYDLGSAWVTYPAATWRHKNHVTLVRAFAPIAADDPDVTLVLTGGAAEAEDDVRREINRLRLDGRIRRTGRVPRADVDALIAGARAVAVPSTFEGFGAPVAEAFALGAPVVASACTALPEVAGDAALLLDPLDVDAWTKALHRLLTEPGLRAELVEAGRRRATELTWDQPVEALVTTWRDALGRA